MNIYDKLYRAGSYNDKVDYKLIIVRDWLDCFKPKRVLDMGCGRGHYINFLTGYKITGVEPSEFLCEEYGWTKGSILSHKGKYDALYCMDVLEHIEPSEIEKTLEALSKLSSHALLGIANHSDVLEGVELHLIQEDSKWWENLLKKYYKQVVKTYEPLNYFIFEVGNV